MHRYTLSLTPALDMGVWSTPRTGKMRGTHCIGGWMGLKAGLDGCIKFRLSPCLFDGSLQFKHIIEDTEYVTSSDKWKNV